MIEDRRAQQEAAKRKEIEEQQRLFMEESLNEKRMVSALPVVVSFLLVIHY